MARLPEQKFRDYLEPRMRDQWMMTWHEDRQVSPGVPDLHYVMLDPDGYHRYKVGWLECKAIDKHISPTNRIGVEASQHQYIRRWECHMPIHFLIRIVDRVFVVPGKFHRQIPAMASYNDVTALSDIQFPQQLIAEQLPPYLRKVTSI